MLTYGAVCGGVSFVFRGVEAGINQRAGGDPFQEGKEGAAIRGWPGFRGGMGMHGSLEGLVSIIKAFILACFGKVNESIWKAAG